MKRGRSTGKPTKREAERIVACKEGYCVACYIVAERNDYMVSWAGGCDYHHLKSGNVRRGHRFGIGLCPYHHRRIPFDGYTIEQTREFVGPSLMDGSRLFHETYGSDDELLALQDEIIGWKDE